MGRTNIKGTQIKDNTVESVDIKDGTLTAIDMSSSFLLDEDNMISNSSNAICTQQSIKAYVDNATGGDTTRINDSGNTTYVDTDATANQVTIHGKDAVKIETTSDTSKNDITIQPGTRTGVGSNIVSGDVNINGGNRNGSGSGTQRAGHVILTGGVGSSSGAIGGNVNINGGNGVAAPGNVNITGGNGTGGSGAGGAITIKSGIQGSGGSGGIITIQSGETNSGNPGGNINIQVPGTGGSNGDINIKTLSGNSTGNINILTGNGNNGAGNIILTAGNNSSGNGGNISITSGNGDNGGNIILTSGSKDSNGTDGIISLNTSSPNSAKLNQQPDGTVDLAIATTKYVDDNAGGSAITTINITETNSPYTASTSNIIFVDSSIINTGDTGTTVVKLPDASSNANTSYHIKNIGTGTVIITTITTGDTIDDETSISITTQYESLYIVSNGSEWFII